MRKLALVIIALLPLFAQAQLHAEDILDEFEFYQEDPHVAELTLNEETRYIAIRYRPSLRIISDRLAVINHPEIKSITFRCGRTGTRGWDYKKVILKGYDAEENMDTKYVLTLK